MQYRHEYKHYMNYADYIAVRSRLRAVMRLDEHVSEKGYYYIRSLYFDNPNDKVLREKADGILDREKFRLRCYDLNYDFIRLEKKVKKGGLGYKLSSPVSREEVRRLLCGDTEWIRTRNDALLLELYGKMMFQGLRPRTIVDYTREPFVYSAGNVRVTLDYNIRTGLWETELAGKDVPTVPVYEGSYFMEVKYDNFLPDVIRDAVQLEFREETAFSKYQACRIFG